jgi:hypothetical protein
MTNEDLDLVIGWLVEHADDAEHVSVVPIAVGGAVSMPEAGATASGELLGVDATDLHMDLRPKYPEPQEIIRSNWRVRLAEG